MKHIFLGALLIASHIAVSQHNYQLSKAATVNLDRTIKILKNPQMTGVLVIAHRGDWRNAPENSIMAIKNSIAMGVDVVEIDLAKTKDGHIVLMHDETLERTTNGKGKVSDWTLDSLKALFLKDGLGIITPHKIPTLEEALMVIKDKILVNLDKGYDYFGQSYHLLKKTGTLHQAIIKSTHPVEKVIAENGRYLKEMMFMPIVNIDDPSALTIIKNYQAKAKPVAFELLFNSDTSKILKMVPQLVKQGSRYWANSLWDRLSAGHGDERAVFDPEANYGWIVNHGFTLIQTDRPAFLIDYLKCKKLHN
ncbi:MAG: glycerophosphodiester phosphodiesterase family protein [Pyrinomonadaceae bacterium]|nr:glycerophosphodiester phosphodiesterase family protein [Sphingobacteriaceae bacterium]